MLGTFAYCGCGIASYLAAVPRPVPESASGGGGVFSLCAMGSGAAGAAGLYPIGAGCGDAIGGDPGNECVEVVLSCL